ncbi:hypothetical protein TREMEDRAFT_27979 [Tremella mesenterica DSM 1558]|uniref:uncharacterized protein n=1 Tax=Tremella mesenterica (strain ATCC 24925 / CBS 8224 / DSM 1558 / NBRC 9311 / NRRL Y-6157 / RJB 2259-6 / UBC 559-6) TaxID=578456 RepID=UPI0003F49B85|nr:uncharacterized protein TREMEDRAFT_27979 [Tremella mesenterica DSM 1558]EIW71801.1 hypothetical protein TREMEDRAFT_27979 [Tremella mesenterica DSM 1558]
MDISSSSSYTLLLARLTISSYSASTHSDRSKSHEPSNPQSHHTLNQPFSSNGIKEPLDEYRNILLGAGTNTLGQLGPLCLLSSKPQTYTRFKPVDLLTPLGLKTEEWEPVKIAVTWSSSFVVYRRILTSSSTSQLHSQPISTSHFQKINNSSEILIACGSNDFGELGYLPKSQPDKISITLPNTTPNIVDLGLGEEERIKFIKGGQRHVICVIESFGKKDRVIGWGASRKGELDGSICFVPWNKGIDEGKGKGKQMLKSPCSQPTEIHLPIPSNVKIVDISLGASHTLVLLSNGNVLAWGNDTKSQITGLNPVSNINDSKIIGIAARWTGSYILDSERKIWSQGSDTHSQLLRSDHSSSSYLQSPDETRTQVSLPPGRVERIVAGSEHLLMDIQRESQLELWTGGWNEHGNLGLGHLQDRDCLTKVSLPGKVLNMWAGCANSWILVDGWDL